MFISTYGYEPVFSQGKCHHVLFQKAVDLEKNVELFEIGFPLGSENIFDGPVYCVKKGADYIPFIVQRSSITSWASITEFNTDERRIINPKIKIPKVKLILSEIGLNLRLIRGRDSTLEYRNVWGDCESHGKSLSSRNELEEIFSYIQEALPLLCFDDYRRPTMPRPSIIESISSEPYRTPSNFINSSSQSESLRVILHNRAAPIEQFDSVIERLENLGRESLLRIEGFMAVLLAEERRRLFWGFSRASSFLNDDRLLPALKSSFEAHYSPYHTCFERFILSISTIVLSRQISRDVFENFPINATP